MGNAAVPPPRTNTHQPETDLPAPIIAPEGVPIVIIFAVVGGAIAAAAMYFLGPFGIVIASICAALVAWCIWFFRDPRRTIPPAPRDGTVNVISPADGVVCFVGPAQPPAELGLAADEVRGLTRVSVFMNVFNVHVNRAPVAGVVERSVYKPGKFFNASFDKASELNERHSIVLRMHDDRRLICVQIAGLVARRIVCRVKEGAALLAAQRYGIIRFGSRVDVYLPEGIAANVRVGQRSVAGETILATLPRAATISTRIGTPAAAVKSGGA